MILKRIASENGSSAIEFAFCVFVFVAMCAFLTDMNFSLIKKGGMERISNSLMMVLRDKTSFYNKSTVVITEADLNNLSDIANLLMKKSDGTIEPYQLGIRMIYFKPESTQSDKIIDEYNFRTKAISGCDIEKNSTSQDKLSALSVWGKAANSGMGKTWQPVYEITLCVPGIVSHFRSFLGYFDKKLGSLYIKNAAIPREQF